MRTLFSILALLSYSVVAFATGLSPSFLSGPFCPVHMMDDQRKETLYRLNHLRAQDNGEVQVLFADPSTGEISVTRVKDTRAGLQLLREANQIPLDLEGWRDSRKTWAFETRLISKLSHPDLVSAFTMRLKDIDSLRRKLFERAPYSLKQLADVTGLRIVVKSLEDAERIADEIKALAPTIDPEVKATTERENHDDVQKTGYRAIHIQVDVFYENPLSFEIQIMTASMESWYSWDHSHVYKNARRSDPSYEKEMTVLKAYSKAINSYIRQKESGEEPASKPSAAAFGIDAQDVMPGYP